MQTSAILSALLRGTMLAQILRGRLHSTPAQSICTTSCPGEGENRIPDAFAA